MTAVHEPYTWAVLSDDCAELLLLLLLLLQLLDGASSAVVHLSACRSLALN